MNRKCLFIASIADITTRKNRKASLEAAAFHKTCIPLFLLWHFIRPRYFNARLKGSFYYRFTPRYVLYGASTFDSFLFIGAMNIIPRRLLCSPWTVKAHDHLNFLRVEIMDAILFSNFQNVKLAKNY